ncbi:ATP synthase subunit I [Clostridium sp. ZS2-4]|uniref:ATP synthase subunit I n=1 Tax=Clostridium sp. ZS2-4 TaxID=2987703 RepID=UPI00227CAAC8|nr:ATP synthase subunit I [Clostridium sp. ZS2-4]MCY6355485.1 ATP synthase subunit I [Clostridium sp. ZS2-4]
MSNIIRCITSGIGGKMKKDDELYSMLRKISSIDYIIGILLIFTVFQIYRKYLMALVLGFILAIINFHINGYAVNYAFSKKKLNSNTVIILSYYLRVAVAGIIGVMLFTYNKFNVLAYILGYNMHFISLTIYGVYLKISDKRM